MLCRDIHEGTYYPAVSLFTLPEQSEGATVTFNFGAHHTLLYNTATVGCAQRCPCLCSAACTAPHWTYWSCAVGGAPHNSAVTSMPALTWAVAYFSRWAATH